jgi:hypothetical protein
MIAHPGARRALGQEAVDQPNRIEAGSFVFARFATGSASALYTGRGFESVGVMGAMIQNRESGYRELIGGFYTQWHLESASLLAAVAFADATDGAYLQVYASPSFRYGSFTVESTLLLYEPLDRSGQRQFNVDPTSIMTYIRGRVRVGIVQTFSAAHGARAIWRGGPALEWVTSAGTLRAEVLGGGGASGRLDIRLGVLSSF